MYVFVTMTVSPFNSLMEFCLVIPNFIIFGKDYVKIGIGYRMHSNVDDVYREINTTGQQCSGNNRQNI